MNWLDALHVYHTGFLAMVLADVVCAAFVLVWRFRSSEDSAKVSLRALQVLAGVFGFNAIALFIEVKSTLELGAQTAALREASSAMTNAAKQLRTEFHKAYDKKPLPLPETAFESTTLLISAFSVIDRTSGHALYYSGEVARAEYDCPFARELFRQYVDVARRSDSQMGSDTDKDFCYAQPHGYCRQRTGFVEYLLAVNFYAEGLQPASIADKVSAFNEARRHLKKSHELYPVEDFNTEIASEALNAGITEQLDAIAEHRPPLDTPVPKHKC